MILMIICCLLPVIAIAAFSYFQISSGWLYLAAVLLCPASHLLMMRGMAGNKESSDGKACPESSNKRQPDKNQGESR
jgi:hypothetical protein